MTRPSRVWITGPGRSGTTALASVFQRLGLSLGSGGTEDDALVRVNDRLLQALYGGDAARWYDTPPPSKPPGNMTPKDQQDIIEVSASLPEVAKDPRWSLTLTRWLLWASPLPHMILWVDRDPRQCAMAWHPQQEGFQAAMEAVEERRARGLASIQRAASFGVPARVLTYPHDFLQRGPVLDAVCDSLPEVDRGAVEEAFDAAVDPTRFHYYVMGRDSARKVQIPG